MSERRTAPLLALFAANAISMTGNVMSLTAIPWFVLVTTGSPAKTGIAAAANLLPIVLANLFGGALVDRLGFRRTSVVADAASGVTVALVPLLHVAGVLELWHLVVLVFFGGLLDAPGTTARQALLPDVARAAGWTLERASGVHAAVERGSRLAGAPLAGVIIAAAGATNVLWIDAATFAVSALLVALVVPAAASTAGARAASYLDDLREGFAFIRRERVLLVIALVITMTNFLDAATGVLVPVLAQRVYESPVVFGLLTGAMGAGSVAGALAFAAFGHRLSRRLVFAVGFIGVTVRYPVLAVFPPAWGAVAGSAAAGVASGPLNPIIGTVMYERVPDALRGRVLGVVGGVAWMAMPLGVLLGGVAVEWVGLRTLLLVLGAVYLATTVSLLFMPVIRDLDAPDAADVRERVAA